MGDMAGIEKGVDKRRMQLRARIDFTEKIVVS